MFLPMKRARIEPQAEDIIVLIPGKPRVVCIDNSLCHNCISSAPRELEPADFFAPTSLLPRNQQITTAAVVAPITETQPPRQKPKQKATQSSRTNKYFLEQLNRLMCA